MANNGNLTPWVAGQSGNLNDKLKPDHWRVPELLQRRATLWCGQEQFHGELHEGCLRAPRHALRAFDHAGLRNG